MKQAISPLATGLLYLLAAPNACNSQPGKAVANGPPGAGSSAQVPTSAGQARAYLALPRESAACFRAKSIIS